MLVKIQSNLKWLAQVEMKSQWSTDLQPRISEPSQTKYLRTNVSAAAPEDAPTTPLAAAHKVYKTAVKLLQPELASILVRLANEFLSCLHKKELKSNIVSKFEHDTEKLPRYVKGEQFTLKGSKLV